MFINEKHFQKVLSRYLQLNGYSTELEYKTATGRIDILATRNRELLIIECKRTHSTNSSTSAIAQLARYYFEVKDFKQFKGCIINAAIAMPKLPSKGICDILSKLCYQSTGLRLRFFEYEQSFLWRKAYQEYPSPIKAYHRSPKIINKPTLKSKLYHRSQKENAINRQFINSLGLIILAACLIVLIALL